jgi:hypothetical protein
VPVVMPVLHAGPIVWPWGVVASNQRGRCSQDPRAVGVGDVRASGAPTVAGGCCRTRDQATRRDAVLPLGAAIEVRDCVAPHAAEDVAHPGPSGHQGKRRGLVGRGGCAAGARQSPAERLVRGDPGQGDREGLGSRARGQAVGDALTVRLVSELGAACGPGGGRGGLWPMRSAVSAWAPQGGAAPEPVTGGACQRGQQRCAGASPRAAGRLCVATRSSRVWPCRHGGRSWSGRDPGPRADPVPPPSRPARPR